MNDSKFTGQGEIRRINPVIFKDLIENAKDCLNKNRLIFAKKFIKKALEIDPENVEAKKLLESCQKKIILTKFLVKAEKDMENGFYKNVSRLIQEADKIEPQNIEVIKLKDKLKKIIINILSLSIDKEINSDLYDCHFIDDHAYIQGRGEKSFVEISPKIKVEPNLIQIGRIEKIGGIDVLFTSVELEKRDKYFKEKAPHKNLWVNSGIGRSPST